jgi:predicted nucleotidyltransferase
MNRQHLPSWVLTAARKVGLTMKADKVLIFGSFARGTQSLKSDLDVFVIADTEDRPLDRIGKVLELLSDVPCGVDAIVYTPAEVERASSKFVDRILKEGVVAYER